MHQPTRRRLMTRAPIMGLCVAGNTVAFVPDPDEPLWLDSVLNALSVCLGVIATIIIGAVVWAIFARRQYTRRRPHETPQQPEGSDHP